MKFTVACVPKLTSFQERVYQLCSSIPKGKVSTYNALARILKSSPRAVGQALKKNPYAPQIPCHRVIKSDGTLGGYAGVINNSKKVMLLKSEGVIFINGKVSEDKIYDFTIKHHKKK